MDFETYNRRVRGSGGTTIYQSDYRKEIKEFQTKVVYPHLSAIEKENN